MLYSCDKKDEDFGELLEIIPSKVIVANGDSVQFTLKQSGPIALHQVDISLDDEEPYPIYKDVSVRVENDHVLFTWIVNTDSISIGEHKGKITVNHTSSKGIETKSFTFYFRVYNKERGFYGCEIMPYDRVVKRGQPLQGEVICIRKLSANGYGYGLRRDSLYEMIYLNENTNTAKPDIVLTQPPYRFSIPTSDLPVGKNSFMIMSRRFGIAYLGAGGGVWVPAMTWYDFTVTE
jgi:hypothetical protein